MKGRHRPVRRVVIVGAGAAGTLTALQLLRKSTDPGLTVTLLERGEKFCRGIAYGTRSRRHLLNVAAGKMSALDDDPDHLISWLSKGPMPDAGPYTFVPRRIFGDYLEETLREAERSSVCRLERVRDDVVGLAATTAGPVVRLSCGEQLHAEKVVLAIGNLPAKNPPVASEGFYESERYIADPWVPCALADAPFDGPVLLIGTSLTAIDVALSLRERGHEAVIHAVSRRGLVPNPHASSPPAAHRDFLPPDGTPFRLADLFRTLRLEARAAASEGRHWQSVIDVLRSRTQALWAVASDEDRRRFLRHVQPYWEAHRHRIAPEVGEEIARMRELGEFIVRAGRIRSFAETASGVEVRISRRDGTSETLEVAKVINCTGPHTDTNRADHVLLRGMLDAGYVRPGPLGLGLDTDGKGAVISRSGQTSSSLYTLGTHRKGHLWETIAVPEIRDQAAAIASDIITSMDERRCRGRLAG